MALGCRVIVGVRNPDSVRQVFEDCGDAVQAGIIVVVGQRQNNLRSVIIWKCWSSEY